MARRVITYTFSDYSDETSGASPYVDPAMDATAETNLRASFAGVSQGTLQTVTDSTITKLSQAHPSAVSAQRELGWKVFCEDTVTHDPYHFTIPVASFTNVEMLASTDYADLTQTPMSAVVTQVNASVFSKAGNSVTVLAIQLVGRDN